MTTRFLFSVCIALSLLLAGTGAATVQGRLRARRTDTEFMLIASGTCTGACRHVETVAACIASATNKVQMPTTLAVGAFLMSRLGLDSAHPLTTTEDSVCPTSTAQANPPPACTSTPHGCIVSVINGVPELLWNQYPSTTLADANMNVICQCTKTVVDEAHRVSLNACGEIPMAVDGTRMDVFESQKANQARKWKNDDAGHPLADPLAGVVELQCPPGTTISGDTYAPASVTVSCDVDTHVLSILDSTNTALTKVPACKPTSCERGALMAGGAISRSGETLGLINAELIGSALEYAGDKALLSGSKVSFVQCSEGHSLDGRRQVPVDQFGISSNSKFELLCRNAQLVRDETNTVDAGISAKLPFGVSGVRCQPVECFASAPIWTDEHNVGSGGPSVYSASASPRTIVCEEGFELCRASKEAGPCPAEHRALGEDEQMKARLEPVCTADATWSDVGEKLEELSCRPVECPMFNFDPDSLDEAKGGFLDPRENTPESVQCFTYSMATPTKDNLVNFECTTGWKLHGNARGDRAASAVCGKLGVFEYFYADDPESHDIVDHPCKRVACRPLKATKNAVEHAESLDHGKSMKIECPRGFSFDGFGRTDEAALVNTFRELQCNAEANEYTCVGGYCRKLDTDLECKEVKCTMPEGSVLFKSPYNWNVEDEHEMHVHSWRASVTGSCAIGYKPTGELATRFSTFTVACEDEWTGRKEYDGWKGALVDQCIIDLEWCAEPNDKQTDVLGARVFKDIQRPQARKFMSQFTLECAEDYVLSKHKVLALDFGNKADATMQPVQCNWEGNWIQEYERCEKIECTPSIPPEGTFGPAVLTRDRASLKEDESADVGVVYVNSKLEYTCADGYRWTTLETAGVDGGHAKAVSVSNPQSLSLICRTDTMLAVTAPASMVMDLQWKNTAVTQLKCVAIFCIEKDTNPLVVLPVIHAEDKSLGLLELTYTWGSGSPGWIGRTFDETSTLRCGASVETAFDLTCAASGDMMVNLPEQGVESPARTRPLQTAAKDLLMACGKQLAVQARGESSQYCVAVEEHEGKARLAVKICEQAQAQTFWFQRIEAEQCNKKMGAAGADGSMETLHEFEFCGELRSLDAKIAGDNLCLRPPAEDSSAAPELVACDETSTLWRLDSTQSTLAYIVPAGSPFKRHIYLAAEKEESGIYKLSLGDYFNPETENGLLFTSLF